MKITHVMADGSIRDSVDGMVIKNDQFYKVLQGIIEKSALPQGSPGHQRNLRDPRHTHTIAN